MEQFSLNELEVLSPPELKAMWQEYFHQPAPRYANRNYLIGKLAYRIQELMHGGLSESTLTQLEEVAKTVSRKRKKTPFTTGTEFIRTYQGVEHKVTVLRDGYSHQGKQYKSLSAVAKAITGTRWPGLTFFGFNQ